MCPVTSLRSDAKGHAVAARHGRPTTLRHWFSSLFDGGRVLDELQARPWGAFDGPVGRYRSV